LAPLLIPDAKTFSLDFQLSRSVANCQRWRTITGFRQFEHGSPT
jgi:hypothetical protein